MKLVNFLQNKCSTLVEEDGYYTLVSMNYCNNQATKMEEPFHMALGEQTPGQKLKQVSQASVDMCETIRKAAEKRKLYYAMSPLPVRVRDMPIPKLSWADSKEMSVLMCHKEDLSLSNRNANIFRLHPNLTPRMRTILFDWLMEVCEVYKMRRVTYYLAIDYVDRFINATDVIFKNHLQLLGITALFIAAKIEEIYPPKLAELAYVTDGACTESEMLIKEMGVLMKLTWDVQPITCIGWLMLYLQLACHGNVRDNLTELQNPNPNDFIYPQFSPHLFMTACMLLDLCSLDDGMLKYNYSMVATSVVYYVLNREKALFVSGYQWEVIEPCVRWMQPFVIIVDKTLHSQPILAPKLSIPVGSALRIRNQNIIDDEGFAIQNHLVNITMLEDVYKLRDEILGNDEVSEFSDMAVSPSESSEKLESSFQCSWPEDSIDTISLTSTLVSKEECSSSSSSSIDVENQSSPSSTRTNHNPDAEQMDEFEDAEKSLFCNQPSKDNSSDFEDVTISETNAMCDVRCTRPKIDKLTKQTVACQKRHASPELHQSAKRARVESSELDS